MHMYSYHSATTQLILDLRRESVVTCVQWLCAQLWKCANKELSREVLFLPIPQTMGLQQIPSYVLLTMHDNNRYYYNMVSQSGSLMYDQ
jgi:hypothetical protein